MTNAYVLMTAMPPTKGHFNLINFAASLPIDRVEVLVCTQPDEPFAAERYVALNTAVKRIGSHRVRVNWLNRELEQDPDALGFWPMWDNIMREWGFRQGDYVVSSEPYGATLAKRLDGIFMPYDPQRELYYTKATNIRENLPEYFHDILPEFQHNLRTTVTIFGAESTGKTTLSKALSYRVNGHWLFEWARPYLELVGPDINIKSMTDIWKGQTATQKHADMMFDKPYVIQDTDLYSTIGYWEQPHWEKALGEVPEGLLNDANALKSDLYIITRSNIPFEEDPIRYGGDHRESPDEYWIALAKKYDLNFVVIDAAELEGRLYDAEVACRWVAQGKADAIYYDRKGF